MSDLVAESDAWRALGEQRATYRKITQERKAQDAKWGEQNHNPIEWMAVLLEEVGEASREALEEHFHPESSGSLLRLHDELVQVAAVTVAMIECGDRNEWW